MNLLAVILLKFLVAVPEEYTGNNFALVFSILY